ncbi:GNAT family N-acetyltransferase [Alcanivorax sp. DP30]|uniref:GNAT family N-acetyltransferase n=1 Tax=Alcanivorax sp. DP30 TaxID=2606217 RepID=UPI00136CB07C|nr:N-acetyltransferase [Alcanivorax sp. DP30]MZR63374.1 GNAT family N-acetyltransferase [Alcanivorax sp. DP30]
MSDFYLRGETPEDIPAIHTLTAAAFANVSHSDQREPFIVDALREAEALSLSLVAELDGKLVGHIAFSPVTLSCGASHWFGLGPVSVLPQWQGHGVGSQLVLAGLDALKKQGAHGCVVLGDPGWYVRFGFVSTPLLRLAGVPAEYFQALLLNGSWPDAEVHYHPAFQV